jgi:DNA-binding transcriptional ArsR family regulator
MRRSRRTRSDAVFSAVSDPTRRAVLDLLRARGPQPAGSIAASFPVSRPAVSRHLRLLRQAQLVRERRDGRHRLYELTPVPLRAVDGWLEWYRVYWRGQLDRLKAFVQHEGRATLPAGTSGLVQPTRRQR